MASYNRSTRVNNKTPAPIQITSQQILREVLECQDSEICPPIQKMTDSTELADYRLRKRKEFEDRIRRVRWNVSEWVKYAQWEESQKDFKRARSIWERALEVDYKNHSLWLKYADMEMKNKFINHARNVLDRAVFLLPQKFVAFEKQYGDKEGIDEDDDAIVGKKYEDEVKKNPLNYDTWFDYIWLVESVGVQSRVREIYERAIVNVPPAGAEEKRYWQRYIYLW